MWEHDPRPKGQPGLAGSGAGLYVCGQPAGEELTSGLGTEAFTLQEFDTRVLTTGLTAESF